MPIVGGNRITTSQNFEEKVFAYRYFQRFSVELHFKLKLRSGVDAGLEVEGNRKPEGIESAAEIGNARRDKNLEILEILNPGLHAWSLEDNSIVPLEEMKPQEKCGFWALFTSCLLRDFGRVSEADIWVGGRVQRLECGKGCAGKMADRNRLSVSTRQCDQLGQTHLDGFLILRIIQEKGSFSAPDSFFLCKFVADAAGA